MEGKTLFSPFHDKNSLIHHPATRDVLDVLMIKWNFLNYLCCYCYYCGWRLPDIDATRSSRNFCLLIEKYFVYNIFFPIGWFSNISRSFGSSRRLFNTYHLIYFLVHRFDIVLCIFDEHLVSHFMYVVCPIYYRICMLQ